MTPSSNRSVARVARGALLALAALGFAWTGWLLVFGGFQTKLFGVRVSSNHASRPFIIAAVAFALFTFLGGRLRKPDLRLPRLPRLPRLGRPRVPPGLAPAIMVAARWRPSELSQAVALSLAVTVFGLVHATTVGGGSDSYGYVSEADLWLAGDARIEQPWVEEAPWPSRRRSFAPLGYRALNEGFVIVPAYSPGLSFLMAAGKVIGGQEGMFWVVPLLGGALVLATFGVARRMAPPGAALIATWLMATSPILLYMVVQPMSDVPAAALWMLACYFLLRSGVAAGAAAGLAAAVAVMVRPNLVFLIGILALWPLWRAVRSPQERVRALLQVVVFAAFAAAGPIVVAMVNQYLYGSPAKSGYGDLSQMFLWEHFWPNMENYVSWLNRSQTMAAVAGAIAVLVPWRRIWPEAEHRRFLLISGAVVASVWGFYCSYLVFNAWWFIRFMLPAVPFIAIGTAAVVMAIRRHGGPTLNVVVTLGVIAVVVAQVRFAADEHVHELWRGERRYAGVGKLVRAQTVENSVVISNQHSGTIRYYGGRMTLRFDNLDSESLDEAVAWFWSRGVRTYLLLEEYEIPIFRRRFEGQATLDKLETPQITYRGPGTAMLYDLIGPVGIESPEYWDTLEGLRSVAPAPPPQIILQPVGGEAGAEPAVVGERYVRVRSPARVARLYRPALRGASPIVRIAWVFPKPNGPYPTLGRSPGVTALDINSR